ncbi:hypothetical protein ACT3UJ_02375 [Halomonas sp. 86]
MDYVDIQSALESRMAEWPGSLPIWFDGTIIPPSVRRARDGERRSPWARFVITEGPARAGEIADKPGRLVPGTISIEIYYPRKPTEADGGTPTNPAYECSQLADQLAAHFEFWQQGHLTTHATSNVRVQPEENWYRRNVITDFDAGC